MTDWQEFCEETGGEAINGKCVIDGDELEPIDDPTQRGLHKMQLARENLDGAYGYLIQAHHETGGAMEQWAEAADLIEAGGHEDLAAEMRSHLGDGVIGDAWTYELEEAYRDDFLGPIHETESDVREDLANGVNHITERQSQVDAQSHPDGFESQ